MSPATVRSEVPAPRDAGSQTVSRSEVEQIRLTVERRGAEIDALQGQSRSRWRDPALLIAVLAIVVSMAAAWFGQQNQLANQATQDRQRLTTILDNIAKVKADARAEGGPFDIGLLIPSLNEAVFLIDRLAPTPQAARPYERLRVAQGFNDANEPVVAVRLLKQAELDARVGGLGDRTDSARTLGISQYLAGDAAEGDRAFERALGYVVEAPPGYSELIKMDMDISTYRVWTERKLDTQDCVGAAIAFGRFSDSVGDLPVLRQNNLALLVARKEADLAAACP